MVKLTCLVVGPKILGDWNKCKATLLSMPLVSEWVDGSQQVKVADR